MLFQVAGGCGLGTLKAADEAEHLGHRRRQPISTIWRKRVMTSGVKRVDVGVFNFIKAVEDRRTARRRRT